MSWGRFTGLCVRRIEEAVRRLKNKKLSNPRSTRQNRHYAVGTKNELSVTLLEQQTKMLTSLFQLVGASSIVSVIVDLQLLQQDLNPDIVSRSSVGGNSRGPSEQLEEAYQSGGHR
ncbi:hypothetical protein BLNAU_18255 [Blattamonas nauphoetae]|uniref:Uncharacterized protein n=1 Tax=Blattamonas nauphoetae TaxID=2049346 RepID=A0ABQ9X782_9EUKA|nr:hypothetical protein BLNAU_18255 [Blattamonas nauphoetae]